MIETRNLQKADHAEIVSVADDWWGHRVSEKLPRLFFKYFRDTSFVLEDDGRIFAFLIGLIPENQKEAYIHFAGVHPEHRKNGLAKRLYEKFFDEARKKGCFTPASASRQRVETAFPSTRTTMATGKTKSCS